jgi:hypothetical protein
MCNILAYFSNMTRTMLEVVLVIQQAEITRSCSLNSRGGGAKDVNRLFSNTSNSNVGVCLKGMKLVIDNSEIRKE